MYKAKTHQHT